MTETLIYTAILLLSLALTIQGIFTACLMLYTWARPERLAATQSPEVYLPPRLSFTAILPARHEQEVIAQTLHRVWETEYPKDLLEVAVVCEQGDTETIAEARRAAAEIDHPNVRVLTFNDGPINKPHGLNVGFGKTSNEVVTIFDAEDDVHPDIFQIVNTVMQRKRAPVVQAGVQLMNFQSNWYSLHNVLEYFFYFKSRLHFHAEVGMIPLGGNTVFVRRGLLEKIGGWDEQCLTEDADIGIRLSELGEKIAVTYDAEHATREETPPTLSSFIKQRTRWNQGFIQILRKKSWRQLPSRPQRLLAAYTLGFPFVQTITGLLWVPAVVMIFLLKVPVLVAMVSLLPLYTLMFQYVINLLGLFEFARSYQLRVRIRDVVMFTVGFLPYQFVLSFGALRAAYREARGMTNWEKTAHTGAHRRPDVVSPLAGYELLLDEASKFLGVECGSVMVLDPDKKRFSIHASRGLSEEVIGSTEIGLGEGVAGWVAQNKRPTLVNGKKLPDGLHARLKQPDLMSSIVVPIEQDGDTIAIVNISSKISELDHNAMHWLNKRAEQLLSTWPHIDVIEAPIASESGSGK